MKPTIHATIIFAGFFVAAGTTAIVTTEYQVVSTKGAAVASLLSDFRAPDRSGAMVARRFELSRDADPFGADIQGRLRSEVAPEAEMAPVIDVHAVALPRATEVPRRTHSHSERARCKTASAAVSPKPLSALQAAHAIQPTASAQPLAPAKPVANLVAYNVSGAPKRLFLPKGFTFYYRTGAGQSEKNAVKIELGEKLLALHQKALAEQLKSIPSGVSAAFIQVHPEDFAKFKELKSQKNLTDVQLRNVEQTMNSAQEMAAAQMESAFQSATNQIQITSSSDAGN